MTLKVITYLIDEQTQQITTEENVAMIMFEDQQYVNNGTWLVIKKGDGAKESISFDPNTDTFIIY